MRAKVPWDQGWESRIGGRTWIDQHTAPRVPSTLAAIGMSIVRVLVQGCRAIGCTEQAL